MKFHQDYSSIFKIMSKGRVGLIISACAANILIAAPTSNTLPTNPTIKSGNININTNSAKMTVNQASQQGVINWGSFNIGKDASVRFNQPNTSASTLNRVIGGELSQIAGQLSSNGRVILVNPNGVIFSNGSRVDVGSIVASTMNISDADYLGGTMKFTRDGAIGKIINQGTITAADGGYVALLAPEVQNEGVVTARKGSIAFAAGDAVTLSVGSSGLLNVEIDPATVNTLIENKGLVEADGGLVYMSSKAATSAISSTISNTGTIQANSLEERDGKVILFAHDGTMNVDGTIEAKGGFVETSGKNVKISDTAKVTTLGNDPTKGEWLIDPTDFTISSGSGAQTTSGIGASTLQTNLAGGNISITTSATANGTDLGDITISAPLSWSANTLSLSAHHSILVNDVVTVSGTGGLTILTNTSGASDTATISAGYLKMKQNRSGTSGTDTFDGKINWSSSASPTINGNVYTVLNTAGALNTTLQNGKAGRYVLGSDMVLSGTWTPIDGTGSSFTGALDGFGHTISGLTVSASGDNQGMFGVTGNGASLANIGLINSTITQTGPHNNTSGFIGSTAGTTTYISNVFTGSTTSIVYADTTATGTAYSLGGLVGKTGSGSLVLKDSYNAANINAGSSGSLIISQAGGLIGIISDAAQMLILKSSYNLGTIIGGSVANQNTTSALSGSIGGIIGYAQNNVNTTILVDLKNYGNIYGDSYVGGIFGAFIVSFSNSGGPQPLERLSNFGNIVGSIYVGGAVGSAVTSADNDRIILKTVSNTGNVTALGTSSGESNAAGGIIGNASSNSIANGKYIAIDGAYNTGAITSKLAAGGIVGSATGLFNTSYYGGLYVYNAYNTGAIRTTASTSNTTFAAAGGLVGLMLNVYLTTSSAYSGNTGYGMYNAYNSGTVTSDYITTNEMVGSIIGKYFVSSSYTTPSIASTYSVTGKVAHDNLIGTQNLNSGTTTINITGFSGVANKTDATLQAATLTSLGFSNGKWAGGNGSTPYLLGFTTPITITLGALSKTYGDANPTITYSDSYISSITWGSAITQWSNAGIYAYTTANMFTPTFITGSAGDYSITYATTSSLTINPKTVTISGTKTYDGAATTANTTFTIGGMVNSDVVTVSSGTANLASKNVGSQAMSSITNLALSSSNYTLTGVSGSVTVSARPITISTSNVTKTYDGGLSASGTATATSGALQGSDSFSGGTYAFTDKNYGSSNKTVTVSGVSVSDGNSGNNYTVTLANNTTSTINKATLTVTGTKVYDGTTAMATYLTLGGFVGSETVGYSAATASSARVATANKYISAITLTDGTNAGLATNYQISGSYIASGAGQNAITITAKTLTPTISNTGVTKVYDGATTSSITPSYTYSGFITGDTAATLTSAAKTYNTKDVSTANTITVSGLAISAITGSNSSAATDYALDNTSKTVAATITPKTVSVSAIQVADKVYDGTTTALSVSATTLTGAVGGDTVNTTGTLGAFTSANVGTYSVSVTGLTLSGADAANYTLSGTTSATDSSVAITAKPLTISGLAASGKTYDGATTATVTDWGTISTGVTGESLTLNHGTAAFGSKNAGTQTVTASGYSLANGAGGTATNYSLASTSATTTAVIAKKDLTATPAIASKVYNGNAIATVSGYGLTGFIGTETVTASGSAAYSDKNAGTGKTVTISGIILSNGTNNGLSANYQLATSLTTIGTITQKSVSVSSVNIANKIYDGTTDATSVSSTVFTGAIAGDTVNAAGTLSAFTSKNVGNYSVSVTGLTLTGADAANYALSSTTATDSSVSITAKPLTYAGVVTSRDYNALTTATVSDALTGVIIGDTVTAAHTTATFDTKNAGTGKTVSISGISKAGADALNYTLATTASLTGTITPVTLTATPTTTTKTYDGTTSATIGGYALAGMVGSETVTASGTATFADKNAAVGKAVSITGITLGNGTNGGLASNYTLASTASSTGTISQKALTMTANANGKALTDVDPTLSANYAGFIGGENATNALTAISVTRATGESAGTYTITPSATAQNYAITPATATFTISPADKLVIQASDATKVYDATGGSYAVTSAKYYSSAGSVLKTLTIANTGNDFTVTDGLNGGATFTLISGAGNSNVNVGSYAITGSSFANVGAPNFTSNTFASGALTITPKELTLNPSITSKVYDGTTTATVAAGYGATGYISNQTLAISGTAAYNNKHAGTGKAVDISGIWLANGSNGGLAANYYATAATTTTGTITAKPITVTATTETKTYDGTTVSGQAPTSSALAAGDTISTAQTFNSKSAGSKTLTPTATITDGNSGADYAVTIATAAGTINKLTITPTASASDKVYDATTNATVIFDIPRESIIGSDTVTATGAGTFNTATVGTGKTVTTQAASILLGGTDGGNYQVAAPVTTTAAITKAALTVTANDDARFVAGEADGVNFAGVRYAGFVGGETSATGGVLGGTLAITRGATGPDGNTGGANTLAGTYTGALTPAGQTATNYDITYSNGNYTIVPANQLLVKVQNTSITYGTTPTYTVTSAKYLATDGSTIVDLMAGGSSVTVAGAGVTIVDGSGGQATFTLSPASPSYSAASKLKIGAYSINATDITESSGNFSDTLTVVGGMTINQKALTPTATNISKVYNGTTNMDNLTLGLTGVETSDTLTITGTGAYATKNVGTGLSYAVNGLALGSADSANYYLNGGNTLTAADGAITAKTVTISATKTYDTTTDLTGAVTVTTGVGAETLNYTGATANSATVPNNATNFISAITLANGANGGDASNYALPTLNHTNAQATINKKALTVVATAASKNLGAVDPTFAYTTSGYVGGETDAVLTGALSRAAGDSPAQYDMTVGTLTADNYSMALTSAKLTIITPPPPPTQAPTMAPTQAPTVAPTTAPTQAPTIAPTQAPTAAPTPAPTIAPVIIPNIPTPPAPTTPNNPTGTGTNTGTGNEGGGTGAGTNTNTSNNTGTGNEGGGTGAGTNTNTSNSSTLSTNSSGSSASSAKSETGGSSSSSSSGQGASTAKQQVSESKASFDGITVGNTQTGSEVRAIIIQGATTSATPVTMLVSVKMGEGFSFSMPKGAVASVAQSVAASGIQGAKVEVTGAVQADGKPLPSWLTFDKADMNFNSSNVPAGGLPLTVKVIVSSGDSTKTIEVVLRGSGAGA
jgi:trimeric autotransporter adhesin